MDRIDVSNGGAALMPNANLRPVLDADLFSSIGRAAYFSLISGTNLGFQQFTPGDWIRRVQSDEYSLQGAGWMRVAAGAQALLSLYLLAMFVLTYFGRPFQ